MNLSNKKAIVYDLGLFTENALRLLRDCAEVKYFVPWTDAFPEPFKAKIGEGLDGLERVSSFEDHIDGADFIFVPDTTSAGLVEWLKKHDYPVAGAGAAEKLELNRWYGARDKRRTAFPSRRPTASKASRPCARLSGTTRTISSRSTCSAGSRRALNTSTNTRRNGRSTDRLQAGPYKEDAIFICEELLEGVEPGSTQSPGRGNRSSRRVAATRGKPGWSSAFIGRGRSAGCRRWIDQGLRRSSKSKDAFFLFSRVQDRAVPHAVFN